MEKKTSSYFIIGTFVTLYLLVSVISTIHVIDFFKLSNPTWLAISLAIAFEVGAAASLASIITLEKMNKGIVWSLFVILTLMQAMGNTYYAYTHLSDFQGWIELFGLAEEELIYQKRVLSIVSGAILPVVALGFIKSLVDYIKPSPDINIEQEISNDDYFDDLDSIETSVPKKQDIESQDNDIRTENYIDETPALDAGKSDIWFDEETEVDVIPEVDTLKSRSDTAYHDTTDPTKL
jgi:hypothetical protein